MKLQTFRCPECGEIASGTLEIVQGKALLDFHGETGEADYGGETKIWWDTQETVLDERGDVTLVCSNGHDWSSAVEDYAP